jgi:hypothetical protein
MGVCRVCDVCLTMVPGPSAILLQRLARVLRLGTSSSCQLSTIN